MSDERREDPRDCTECNRMGMTWGCLNGDMPCPWEGSEAYASQMKDIEIAKMKERLATGRVVRPA